MIEKILERLEEAKFPITDLKRGVVVNGIQQTDDAVLYARAIEIVQEVAKEYTGELIIDTADMSKIDEMASAVKHMKVMPVQTDGGWILCEVALPKEATTYEVTCEIILCSKKQYITTYALWGTEGEWICRKNERVIAWKEKSAPYQKGE